MTRNFKVLGLVLCACVAMSAVAAQSAFAAVSHTFESTATPVTLTGDDDGGVHVLTAKGVPVECNTSTFVGEGTEATEDQQVLTPTYTECKLGGVEVKVENEGCTYTFDSDTTADPNTGGESGTVQIKCPAGKFIKIIGPGCTIDFGSQGPLHGVTYTNVGSAPSEDITVDAHVFGIKYNATNNGCALLGIAKGEHEDGTYLGNSTVRGYQKGKEHIPANQIGIRVVTP